MKSGPRKFGALLRAYRLGFHYSAKRQAMIRLGVVNDKTINVEMMPEGYFYKTTRGRRNERLHVCWWEDNGKVFGDRLLDMIPALRHVRRVKTFVSFDIDFETGERITK